MMKRNITNRPSVVVLVLRELVVGLYSALDGGWQ
jgi:hypothetical protein